VAEEAPHVLDARLRSKNLDQEIMELICWLGDAVDREVLLRILDELEEDGFVLQVELLWDVVLLDEEATDGLAY